MNRIKILARGVLLATAFIFALSCTSCANSQRQSEVYYEHKHCYESAWSFNQTEHWHGAACRHNVMADKGAHIFAGDGNMCTVCGYAPDTSADELPLEVQKPNEEVDTSLPPDEETDNGGNSNDKSDNTEENNPPTNNVSEEQDSDGNFLIEEGEFSDWVGNMLESTAKTGNSSMEITVAPQEYFTVGCEGGALVIAYTSDKFGLEYSGLCVNLKKSARVTLTLFSLGDMPPMIGVDGSDDLAEISAERQTLSFDLAAGEHAFSFHISYNTKIVICGLSVIFDD